MRVPFFFLSIFSLSHSLSEHFFSCYFVIHGTTSGIGHRPFWSGLLSGLLAFLHADVVDPLPPLNWISILNSMIRRILSRPVREIKKRRRLNIDIECYSPLNLTPFLDVSGPFPRQHIGIFGLCGPTTLNFNWGFPLRSLSLGHVNRVYVNGLGQRPKGVKKMRSIRRRRRMGEAVPGKYCSWKRKGSREQARSTMGPPLTRLPYVEH